MTYAASTLTTFGNVLGTLDHLLERAEQSGTQGLLDARLAADMFPASTQIRMVTFQVLNALNRLAGGSHALAEADPADYTQARSLVAESRAALGSVSEGDFMAAGDEVEFDIPNGMAFALTAEEYVRDWVMAQLYFHATTFYAILRAQGLPLGKADFVGYMVQHLKKS